MATKQSVKDKVKQILKSGLQEVEQEKAKLEERRQSLLEELKQTESSIAKLDEELAGAVRESLKELNIATEPAKKKRTRKRGGPNMADWILDLLQTHGPLKASQINEHAEKEGLNLKSVAVQLSKMSQAAKIKGKAVTGERGKLYSLS